MPWDDRPTPAEALADHEVNPEYELHLGQEDITGNRKVSIWLRGERWSGWLSRD